MWTWKFPDSFFTGQHNLTAGTGSAQWLSQRNIKYYKYSNDITLKGIMYKTNGTEERTESPGQMSYPFEILVNFATVIT